MNKLDLVRNFLERNRRVLAIAALAAALMYFLDDRQFGPVTRALFGVVLGLYGSLIVRLYKKTPFHWRRKGQVAADWSLAPTEAELHQVTTQARAAYGSILRSSVSGKRLLLATLAAGAPAAWLLWQGRPVNFLPLWILGWVIYEFTPIDRVRASEVGLLFRRFSASADSDRFCVNVANATQGMCCVLTIQDRSYPGDGSIRRHAVAYLLVIFAIPQFFLFLLLGSYGAPTACIVFILEWIALELYRSHDFYPVNTEMTESRIDDYMNRVQHGRWHDNGVHAIRFADQAWRPAVLYALRRAAVALVSIDSRFMTVARSENENLLWEIDQALRTVHPHRIIFIWSEAEQEAMVIARPSVSSFLRTFAELTGVPPPNSILRSHFVGFSSDDKPQLPDLPESEAKLRLTLAAAVASSSAA